MMTKTEFTQSRFHMLTINDMVPETHLLRKIHSLVDFSFVYEQLEGVYCIGNGRPSIDPVVLIKMLLIGFLYGIPSERRIVEEVQVNMAYRWFLGLDIFDKVPDHSTISQNRRRRFNGTVLFRTFFEQIVQQCIDRGLVDGKLILTDSTHVKANASRKSEYKKTIKTLAYDYIKELDYYETEERIALETKGLIPKAKKKNVSGEKYKTETITRSKTDPDSGYYKRKGKPLGMHYLSHETVDASKGIIIDVHTTPGNVPDSKPYIERIDHIRDTIGIRIESACADSSYDAGLIHQQLYERGIDFFTPEPTEQKRGTAFFQKDSFTYDEKHDCYICPAGKKLSLARLQRTPGLVARQYQSDKCDCHRCEYKDKCLTKSTPYRRLNISIFHNIKQRHHQKDGTIQHKTVMDKRQIWCEGTFAAQFSEKNGMGCE